jgi:hypothetical protein
MSSQLDTVAEEVRERLISELGFRVDTNDEYGVIKDITETYGMVFYHEPEEGPMGFGFYHYDDKSFSRTQVHWLRDIIFQRWEFTADFDDDFYDWGDQWLCKRFTGNNRQGWANADMVNFLVDRYEWLEKTAIWFETH